MSPPCSQMTERAIERPKPTPPVSVAEVMRFVAARWRGLADMDEAKVVPQRGAED